MMRFRRLAARYLSTSSTEPLCPSGVRRAAGGVAPLAQLKTAEVHAQCSTAPSLLQIACSASQPSLQSWPSGEASGRNSDASLAGPHGQLALGMAGAFVEA